MSYNSSFTGQQADAALQKAAIIQTDGAGTQFLSNDGTYKDASGGSGQYLDMSIFASESGTLSEEDYQKVVDAYNNRVAIAYDSDIIRVMGFNYDYDARGSYSMNIYDFNNHSERGVHAAIINVIVNTDKSYYSSITGITLKNDGDGSKFLSDDGTYKAVSSQPMQVLTESEYAALGTTPETDGVLYFVTPD